MEGVVNPLLLGCGLHTSGRDALEFGDGAWRSHLLITGTLVGPCVPSPGRTTRICHHTCSGHRPKVLLWALQGVGAAGGQGSSLMSLERGEAS